MSSAGLIDLKELSLDQTIGLAIKLGKQAYTGKQLYKWVFREGETEFAGMTDLSLPFRRLLGERATIGKLKMVDSVRAGDGTIKTIWDIGVGGHVESVLIPDDDRLTLCVSSQAGCPVGCRFCATGLNGFRRKLTSGEIYDQYLLTRKKLTENTIITNVVFMGMGEPLLNYRNLLKSIETFTSQFGGGFAAKRITISTVGYVNGIRKLADDNPRLGLAISLHSANEKKRRLLIPIAKRFSLKMLKEAALYYAGKADDRVTFEYLLLRGINDSAEDAAMLANFVKGIPCKINLISYNEVAGSGFAAPDESRIMAFRDYLYPRAPVVTIRKSKGTEIAAACGQLAGRLGKGRRKLILPHSRQETWE